MSETAPLPWPPQVLRTRGDALAGRPEHPGRFPATPADEDVEQLVARFTTACELVGGAVHHLSAADDVAALIAQVSVDGGGAATPAIISWAPDMLPLPGVLDGCAARGMAVLETLVRTDAVGQRDDLARLETASVGVTGALAVLADTGSLIVSSGAGRPRLASLLPPVHVALVTRPQLVSSLSAWVAAHPAAAGDAANLVVITGPSRTADIEMTLTRGVHGPRAVHVVFVG